MKKSLLHILISLLAVSQVFAQHANPASYPEWDPKPQMHVIPPETFNEHAVVLMQSTTLDYIYEGYGLTQYRTLHRIIKVLDNRGIEAFNTVSIPLGSRIDSIKARTILPDGTTKDIKYEMMHLSRDGDGGVNIIFAMDAVEKNAEIEVLIKDMTNTSFFGSYQLQFGIPVLYSSFQMNYPKRLSFEIKGYHGFPTVKEVEAGGRKHISVVQTNIPALEPEHFSFYDLYCMRVDYRMNHILNRNNQKVWEYSWNRYAGNLYDNYYNVNDTEKKAANRFLTIIGIRGDEDELVKIKKIENGIKTLIVKSPEMDDRSGANLDSVVRMRAANADGIIKLFTTCLNLTSVKHELGYTSDRTEHMVDVKFPNWAILRFPIIYFPHQNSYLSPLNFYLRNPVLPTAVIGNRGIFCATDPAMGYNFGKVEKVGEAVVRLIEPIPANQTVIDFKSELKLDEQLNATATEVRHYTGYGCEQLRGFLNTVTKDNLKEGIMEYLPLADRKEHLREFSTANEQFGQAAKPLEIKTTIAAPQLTEKAGADYLFRIGAVYAAGGGIYEKKERVLPVDFKYPFTKKHVITFDIPTGYKVSNLAALEMDAEHTDLNDGHVTASFHSGYTINKNKLVVTVTETISRLHYPTYEFATIKKVINAGTEFSQVSILLQKDAKKKATHKAAGKPVAFKK